MKIDILSYFLNLDLRVIGFLNSLFVLIVIFSRF